MKAGSQTTPPLLLDYRHPDTDPPPKFDWSHPRYAAIAAGVMALIGLLSAQRSLGNAISVFSLPLIASWYVTVRTCRDREVAPGWRATLSVLAVCCVLLAAWAQTVDHGMPLYVEHWQIYGHVREELYPLGLAVAAFAMLRGVRWASRQKSSDREPVQ